MNTSKRRFSAVTVFFAAALSFAAIEFGGAGGCGGGTGTSGTTRNLTGTLDAGSLSSLTVKSPSDQAGLKIKRQASLSCSDVQVCCMGYDGSTTAVSVGSDCKFSVGINLNSFCYCALFTGSDSDGDGCKDDYIAEMGCSENSFSGTVPVFADADGGTGDIDLGSSSVEGGKVVSANDICSQVDADGDGTDDAADPDDDNDGISDDDDAVNDSGCEAADEADQNNDDIPDIFESEWDDLTDSDGDNIPDFCDVSEISTDCEPDDTDTDGNCIPDSIDQSDEDSDGDGITADEDCDDNDESVTLECYGDDENICGLDDDGDGVGFCDDCDDEDAGNTLTIAEGCDVTCAITSCSDDFECEFFADDEVAAGNDICGGGDVSCMTCTDGCCVQ